MVEWFHDPNSHRLVKGNSETLLGNLFDSPLQSHTSSTMAEEESVHNEHENQPL